MSPHLTSSQDSTAKDGSPTEWTTLSPATLGSQPG